MSSRLRIALALGLLAWACGGSPSTGPVEPAWDRDTCEHCSMAVSDRHFAAQIRSAVDGKVRHFDDPGCAALFGVAAEDEVWVRDAGGGGVAGRPHGALHHGPYDTHGLRLRREHGRSGDARLGRADCPGPGTRT